MKNKLILLFLFASTQLLAQDIIIKTDGNEINSKVIEITLETIKYKKYEHLDGPIRNINIADVFMIIYENGDREKFSGITKKENNETRVENVQSEQKVIVTEQKEPHVTDQKTEQNIDTNLSDKNSSETITETETKTESKIESKDINEQLSNKVEIQKPESTHITSQSLNSFEDEKPVVNENSYNGKYSFLSLGYGTSYGGLGAIGQFRTGSEFGFGVHAGIGYFPKAKYLASVGAKLYLYKGFYFGVQYGRTGWEELTVYNNTESNTSSHVLNGYSYMTGIDWVWGKKKKVGMNVAIGITKNNNVKYIKSMEQTLAIDVGFVFR